MLYFAYGSNLCASRLVSRAPSARFVVIGHLEAHDLIFHKQGRDGTAKADAAESATDTVVWGAIAELSPEDLIGLDRFEPGYRRSLLPVVCEDSVKHAWVYRAEPTSIRPDLVPQAWYLGYILHGGRARGLPSDYLDDLERTTATAHDVTMRSDLSAC
ncbi:MAG: gamma-glutamylcyclotransferase [Acidimicrobiia bacterium]|nr:gamma-glutamylcyclotransferase [Acidimicrobiia bacterium]NNF64539.1 gamma-glutamylcyclotransferase [Acidimicrobiia bacterium]